MTTKVIELVLFRIQPTIDVQQFTRELAALTNLIQTFPGFIHREIGVSEDGLWMDRVQWKSFPEAQHAAERIMGYPEAQAVFGLIDPQQMQMYHFRSIE